VPWRFADKVGRSNGNQVTESLKRSRGAWSSGSPATVFAAETLPETGSGWAGLPGFF
jgi:hypothetical protein